MLCEITVCTTLLALKVMKKDGVKVFNITVNEDGTLTIQSDKKVFVVEKSPKGYWIRIV